jgi:hypothetical protein
MTFTRSNGENVYNFRFPFYSKFATYVQDIHNIYKIFLKRLPVIIAYWLNRPVVAILYSDRALNHYFEPSVANEVPIVIEFCGESSKNIDLLQEWKTKMDAV